MDNHRALDGRSLRTLLESEQRTSDVAVAIAASRQALAPWVAQLRNWDIYATFTYDEAKLIYTSQQSGVPAIPPSDWATRRHMLTYLEILQDELGREIGAFCALETTRRGWPHWHGLIAAGGLQKDEFTTASSLWFERRGYAKFARVDMRDQSQVAAYCSKYLCKEDGDVLLWGKLAGSAMPGQLKLRKPKQSLGEV